MNAARIWLGSSSPQFPSTTPSSREFFRMGTSTSGRFPGQGKKEFFGSLNEIPSLEKRPELLLTSAGGRGVRTPFCLPRHSPFLFREWFGWEFQAPSAQHSPGITFGRLIPFGFFWIRVPLVPVPESSWTFSAHCHLWCSAKLLGQSHFPVPAIFLKNRLPKTLWGWDTKCPFERENFLSHRLDFLEFIPSSPVPKGTP